MARINTGARTLNITGTYTLTYAFSGGLITMSGTAPYTVTLASPVSFPGAKQEFFNNTSGTITLATSAGTIIGPGFTAASSQSIPAGATFTLISNGSDYVVTNDEGGPLRGTDVLFTSTATVPAIRGSTANSGTLTINATSSSTKPTAGILMTDGISSTGTSSGTLVVTGGVGVSENIRAGGTIYGTLSSTNVTLSTTGSINGITIGASSASTGAFTTLGASSTATFTGAITANTGANSQSFTTTGAGSITITSATTGNINGMNIGATTAGTGRFSSLTVTGSSSLTSGTISTAPSGNNDIANKAYVDGAIKKITGFGLFYGAM